MENRHYSPLALLHWAGLFLLSISLFSCNSAVYDNTIVVEKGEWTYATPISFEFEIQDTSKLYNVFLEVNHQADYAFENAYCFVETYAQNSLVKQQQLSLELASPKGVWNGKCSGEVCTHEIPLMVKTAFPTKGIYKIVLSQYTRHETLMGINSLRLMITERVSTAS